MLRHENVSNIPKTVKLLHKMQIKLTFEVSQCKYLFPCSSKLPCLRPDLSVGEQMQGWSHFYLAVFPHSSVPKNKDKEEGRLVVPQNTFARPSECSHCPVLYSQVNDPALRGGNLFPNQLPGMDMIKQEGDASRVRNSKEICDQGSEVNVGILQSKTGRYPVSQWIENSSNTCDFF